MLPKIAFLLPFLLWMVSSPALWAQDNLYLENPGRLKRILVQPGDSVRFRIQGDEHALGGRYIGAREPWVYLRGDSVQVTAIDALWVRPEPGRRYWLAMLKGAFIMTAIVYPAMILLNRTAVTGYDAADIREAAIVAGVAIAGSIFMNVFRWRKYRFDKGKWKLKIMIPVERL